MRFVTLAVVLVIAIATANGQTALELSGNAATTTISTRFLERVPETLIAFRAQRRLDAHNARFNKHGWLHVRTELSPENGFTFDVIGEGGSSYIRTKVLRPILGGERDLISRGDVARSALTSLNYDITGEEAVAPGLVRLTVKPLRREMTLIDGAVFVTDSDADLVRVEGRLARNPSFWTTRVDIVRRYARVAGVRVPLSIDSVAHVRLVGTSEMTMTYCYEMVNGHAVRPGTDHSCPDTTEAP